MLNSYEVMLLHQSRYDAKKIAEKIAPYIDIEECKKIFIKPNMVINPWKEEYDNWNATVTNASLIEAVLLVISEKAKNKVRITIGDAPMARSNHAETLKRLGMHNLISKYSTDNIKIEIIDIREWYWKYISNMCVSRKRLSGDPNGCKLVNLGKDSAFEGKRNKEYEAFDNIHPVHEFHNEKDNIFTISSSVLDSDLFINLPKMKTHRIAGMTCAMKNLVGINANKNCVPHNTLGSDKDGGDTFKYGNKSANDEMAGIGGVARRVIRRKNPVLNYCMIPAKIIYDKIKSPSKSIGYGMWYGNDTIWRSIIDLNRIILYCDKFGIMQDSIQRRYVSITDAIISGEGEGPLHPSPIKTDYLIVSTNPVANDLVAAVIMGFDYKKMPFLQKALDIKMKWPLVQFSREDIIVNADDTRMKLSSLEKKNDYYHFRPTEGWIGHIEKAECSEIEGDK